MCCFYVTHRQVAGLFAEDEERLADFVATLAGAALENADGFDELHLLNQALEHKIAESQRAEKRIQEQAALLDKARDAISVQDLDDRLLFWNQSAQSLYGWSATEALGQKACDLLYREPSQLQAAFQTVLQRGEWTGELRQLTRAGKEIIVESRWSLVSRRQRPAQGKTGREHRRHRKEEARIPILAGPAHGKHRHPGRRHCA